MADVLMPLIGSSFPLGKAAEFVESIENADERAIAKAELAYFTGNPEQAYELAKPYLESPKMGLRSSACFIVIYASLPLKRTSQANNGLTILQRQLAYAAPSERAAARFAYEAAYSLLHLSDGTSKQEDAAHTVAMAETIANAREAQRKANFAANAETSPRATDGDKPSNGVEHADDQTRNAPLAERDGSRPATPAQPGKSPQYSGLPQPDGLPQPCASPQPCGSPDADAAIADNAPTDPEALGRSVPLSEGVRLFATYVAAHQAYLRGEYEYSLGLATGALSMATAVYPISFLYLHLIQCMSAISLKRSDLARKVFAKAWGIARADDLIQGIGEHHGLLGGLIESCVKPQDPEAYKRIIEITYSFSKGWRMVHNPTTGEDVADNLSTTEFSIAMLLNKGWTTREVAVHLGVTENTVKTHVKNVYRKLGISNRKELGQFMLR